MIPTAEEFLNGILGKDCYPTDTPYALIEFAKLHTEAALKAQAKRIIEIYDEFISAESREDLELCRDIDFCAFVDDLESDPCIEYPLDNIK